MVVTMATKDVNTSFIFFEITCKVAGGTCSSPSPVNTSQAADVKAGLIAFYFF